MLLKHAFWFVILLILALIFWTEFVLFYVSLLRCTWPTISEETVDKYIHPGTNLKPVKILLISDTHVNCRHQWIDRIRRHWLLKRGFRTIMSLYHPDVVVHLGDLLDRGYFESDEDFEEDVKIVRDIFAVDSSTTAFKIIPGNHDLGFHYQLDQVPHAVDAPVPVHISLRPHTYRRFSRAFLQNPSDAGANPLTLWAHKGLLFVFANSMAFEGDGCQFCRRTDESLQILSTRLQCLRGELALDSCQGDFEAITEFGSDVIQPGGYSHPILMQHFPLYRPDETVCKGGERDSMPEAERKTPYKPDFDCLSDSTTRQIFFSIRPRLVFGGHSHYYCHRNHTIRFRLNEQWKSEEWSLPAFSYRVSKNPGFVLLHASPNGYAVRRCHLPTEVTMALNYVVGLCLIALVYLLLRRCSTNAVVTTNLEGRKQS